MWGFNPWGRSRIRRLDKRSDLGTPVETKPRQSCEGKKLVATEE